jgi:hypothetical protein
MLQFSSLNHSLHKFAVLAGKLWHKKIVRTNTVLALDPESSSYIVNAFLQFIVNVQNLFEFAVTWKIV